MRQPRFLLGGSELPKRAWACGRVCTPNCHLALETGAVASDIAIAFIGGGAGLLTGAVTGTISSLVAPWANWGIEKKRRTRELQLQRVVGGRKHLEHLNSLSEKYHGRALVPGEDPISADVRTKDWFITLRAEMSADALRRVEELSQRPVHTRRGEMATLLGEEISRIEREKWDLI